MIKILFFSRIHKNELCEYDFIINDILPEKIKKSAHFLSLEEVRNSEDKFDVLVYSCRDPNNYPWGFMPTFEQVLEVVNKTKPTIIIQLSDEFIFEDLQIHNTLGNYCKLFLRQHHHPNYHYTNNTIHLPLAYCNDTEVVNKNILKISDRSCNWSFFGEIKSDRFEMIENFKTIDNYLMGSGIKRSYMADIYLNSIFVPSGRGNSSLNCFRLYEASMSGAIPIVVGSKEELDMTFEYEENPPWIFSDSWNNAVEICKELLKDLDKLQEMQDYLLCWWNNRIRKIQEKVNQVLISKTIPKLKDFPSINFISIEESEDRRKFLYQQFEEYGLTNITPHIYKRYNDDDHKIIGGPLELHSSGRGPVTSHLKAIKEWYQNTDEPYTFFCEDDLSFESVKYWNFTWSEFFSRLPSDWSCIQLCLVREEMFLFSDYGSGPGEIRMRLRYYDDWSGCAYLISRKHAKNLIDNYYPNDYIILEYMGIDKMERVEQKSSYYFLLPQIENLIYSYFVKGDNGYQIYSFPLFLENTNMFQSTWVNRFPGNVNAVSYLQILEWWKNVGKDMKLEQLIRL